MKDERLTLNGLQFHYRDWGDKASPALIVLHGFTHHSRVWDTFARAMQDRYRVLVLDQRGHGETEWASDYSDESMISDVEAFRRELGLERFALLGHSMGGLVGYVYAARHPKHVDRLVILESGPPLPGEVAGSGAPSVEKSPEFFESPEEAVQFARTIFPLADEAELRNQMVHNLVQREDLRWTWRYDRVGMRGDFPAISPSELWGLLPRIVCPTLLVLGANSPFSRERANQMMKVIPTCRMVEIPGSGHGPQRDNPSGLLQSVRGFLED